MTAPVPSGPTAALPTLLRARPRPDREPPSGDRRRPALRLTVVWLVSRAVMMALFATPAENVIQGDPFYYHRRLQELASAGIRGVMQEYPVPAVWVLELPLLGVTALGYVIAFVALMAVLDAGFTWLLWRASGHRRTAAVEFWVLFVVAVGPLTWFRFDLLPAVLVGAALLASVARPRLAGALAAAGAATKLWPALVWPALMCRPGARRWWTTLAFLATGVVLALASLLAGGWQRLVSPLTWQSDRGLQIESVAATPLMVARWLRPDVWRVELSPYNAYEIVTGPGIATTLRIASIATAVGLVVIMGLVAVLLLQLRRLADGAAVSWRIGMLVLAIVLIMIVTNKTFSPQYVVWLAGPVAYLLLHCGTDGPRARSTRRLALAALVLAVLTQLVYPVCYPPLYGAPGPLGVSTVLLAVRNVALCAITAVVVVRAVRPPAVDEVSPAGTS